jgi:energy-coupling factor transporter ATP-binding protein EcfA2
MAKKKARKKTRLRKIDVEKATSLVNDPLFLYKASRRIGKLGVIGEKRNRLILALAGIARTFPKPPSVLIIGQTPSGKSTLVKAALQLFPPDCVVERAGLSAKALAHGKGSLADKILFIQEYRCGKAAGQLLRLLQSEGRITHEFTTLGLGKRGTKTVQRVGTPVVITTTTPDEKVFEDDSTRFLITEVDASRSQNLAIVTARALEPKSVDRKDLPIWQTAMSLLTYKKGDFEHPPKWLQYVAKHLPLDNVRVRRDWDRFLTFSSAIASCRDFGRDQPIDIGFEDYCIAYRILEPVFASTLRGLPTQEFKLAEAVRKLNHRRKRAVTVHEIAHELRKKKSALYKHIKDAVKSKLIEYESGTRERNEKRLLARKEASRFLPHPRLVLQRNPEIGRKVKYVDPFTGKWRKVER